MGVDAAAELLATLEAATVDGFGEIAAVVDGLEETEEL